MRRKKSRAAALRRYWLIFIPLIGAAAVAGYYAAMWPGFHPRIVEVSGNRSVSTAEIRARATISRYRNLWLQDMTAATRRVAAIPQIAEVHIARALPARVHISVTERVPYARVATPYGALEVDRAMRILPDDGARRLPIMKAVIRETNLMPGTFLRDRDLRTLVHDNDLLVAAGISVSQLSFDRYGDLVAVMRGGVRLLLGAQDDLTAKIALVKPILTQTEAAGRRIAAIDLRALKTPVVVYR